MTQRTRSDSRTKNCTLDGCDNPLRARGVCNKHYKQIHYVETGKPHHVMYQRTCVTCGAEWSTPRPEARFCTAKCKGAHLAVINKRHSKLPADHPVMVLIAEAKAVEAAENERKREQRKAAARSRFEWRTARECPGCACMFTPLYTPNAVTCSKRCQRRMVRRRRRAREVSAYGSWVWSDFLRIARKFDFCCAYCGVKPTRLDADHVVPLARGGYDSPSNLLPTCHACNGDKSALSLAAWAESRARRGLEPRVTSWSPDDRRYWHLTQVMTAEAVAA